MVMARNMDYIYYCVSSIRPIYENLFYILGEWLKVKAIQLIQLGGK